MKKILVPIVKAAILWPVLSFLWISLVLIWVSGPTFLFMWQPFLQAMTLPVIVTAVVSIARRSATPLYWALFCCMLSVFFFAFPGRAPFFMAPFLAAGVVSFFYRNKFTEPMLAMLPIAVGSWLFLNWVYAPYLVSWAYYTTGHQGLSESASSGLFELSERILIATEVAPVLVIYFLGKHGYVAVYNRLMARFRRPEETPS